MWQRLAAASGMPLIQGVLDGNGILAWPTLISLLTVPVGYQTWKGLTAHYNSPYQLMFQLVGKNLNLHLYTGLLLIVGVLVGILVRR